MVLAFALSSCVKDAEEIVYYDYTQDEFAILSQKLNLPTQRDQYLVELSQHMRNSGMVPPTINDAKATLGRVLFFDKQLSLNNAVSCASCHKQNLAFSDDKALSDGFNGGKTARNSLALGAVPNFQSSYDGGSSTGNSFVGNIGFFWDERANSIAEQSTLTIQDEVEMGMNLTTLSNRLNGLDYYRVLFDKAYQVPVATPERITEALQEFINAFISTDSKFDAALDRAAGPFDTFRDFTVLENQGKNLFLANCSSCHGSDMSNPVMSIASNGLDEVYTDKGVGAVRNSNFDGMFKVPFLRNIALTGPYMHDGRFATLEDVVEHYSHGIKNNANLSEHLRDPNNPSQPLQMNFSAQEKEALIAFLHTLTDYTFITDGRFGDPFQ